MDLTHYSEILAGLGAIATTIATSYALRVDFSFEPDGEPQLSLRLSRRIAVFLGVITIASTIYYLSSRSNADGLLALTILFAAVSMTSLVIYLTSRAFGLIKFPEGQFVRGMWLTEQAREKLSGESSQSIRSLLRNDPGRIETVWPRLSRTAVYAVIALSALTVVASSTVSVCMAISLAIHEPKPTLVKNIDKIVTDWKDFELKSSSQVPAELEATCEAVLAEWPTSAALVVGNVKAESIQSMATTVDNYLSVSGENERQIDWLASVVSYHYEHSRREDLALAMQERQLEVIANTLKETPAPAKHFDDLIARGFSVLTDISDVDPERVGGPSVVRSRMILHHKKAQSYAQAHKGLWDPAELAAAYALAEKLMKTEDSTGSKNLDLIINILMRKLNVDSDDQEKRPLALIQASEFLKYAEPAFTEGLDDLNMSSFAVVVNYAKLNEERILFSVYGAYPVDSKFVDQAGIADSDLDEHLRLLQDRSIVPLRRVKAFLSGREEWHHWANVTLDIARASGLAAELTRMSSNSQSSSHYVTESITELNEINRSQDVDQNLKARLMTDIVNRPEYATVRNDDQIKHIVDFYRLEGR